MRTSFLTFIILILFVGSSITLAGQNEKEGLKAINLAYQNYSRLSMDITYKVFESWNAAKPLQEEKGALKCSGKMTWSKIGPMEFVRNADYSVVVDNDDKTIGIFGIFGDQPEADYNEVLPDMENILKQCREIKHKDLNNSRGQYDIVFPDDVSAYKKISLIYDKSTYLLYGLTLFYAQTQDILENKEKESPPRLEITYSNINTNPTLAANTFTYEVYLRKAGKILVCKEKYAEYELIDKYSRP